MADSGARGSKQQIRQLSGMRGLMAKPSGEIIETPITANFREGLNVLQYFISTHGARKGLADTALKTADSGYLTRRLVDVAQDVIVTEHDCGTARRHLRPSPSSSRARSSSRCATASSAAWRRRISTTTRASSSSAPTRRSPSRWRPRSRTPVSSGSRSAPCSPASPAAASASSATAATSATGRMVERGEAVGVIAAQSIGEPGTQLTMRTFHIGGTATGQREQITPGRQVRTASSATSASTPFRMPPAN